MGDRANGVIFFGLTPPKSFSPPWSGNGDWFNAWWMRRSLDGAPQCPVSCVLLGSIGGESPERSPLPLSALAFGESPVFSASP